MITDVALDIVRKVGALLAFRKDGGHPWLRLKNQSVLKAFRMLKGFLGPDEWLTSCELSRRANLPEASGYRLIQTLEQIGAVVRRPQGRYRPGMLLDFAIAQCGDRRSAAGSQPQDHHRTRLSPRSDDPLIELLEGGMVTYIAKVCTPHLAFAAHPPWLAVGSLLLGPEARCFLAALPQDQLDGFIMDGDLVALTPCTITDRTALRAELQKVRIRGYAVDDREIRADMRCLGGADPPMRMDAWSPPCPPPTMPRRMTEPRQTEVRIALRQAAHALECKVFPPGPSVVAPMSARAPGSAIEMPCAGTWLKKDRAPSQGGTAKPGISPKARGDSRNDLKIACAVLS